MRPKLAPEFPTRRPARPLVIPNSALVLILALLALLGIVVSVAVINGRAGLLPQ
jgi:hypothetical protein